MWYTNTPDKENIHIGSPFWKRLNEMWRYPYVPGDPNWGLSANPEVYYHPY